VGGTVGPVTTAGTAQTFSYSLTGVDPACASGASTVPNSCGIHIHSGTSCLVDALGHYYDVATLSADPWASVVYTAGVGIPEVNTGLTAAQVEGKAMIIHNKAGNRIACALLQQVLLEQSCNKHTDCSPDHKCKGHHERRKQCRQKKVDCKTFGTKKTKRWGCSHGAICIGTEKWGKCY